MSGDVEKSECSFCHEVKLVSRMYLRPSNYVKPKDPVEYCKLYNEGSYFIIIWYCADCGCPKC